MLGNAMIACWQTSTAARIVGGSGCHATFSARMASWMRLGSEAIAAMLDALALSCLVQSMMTDDGSLSFKFWQ